MQKEDAKKFLETVFMSHWALNDTVACARSGMPEEEFRVYRKRIAAFLGDMLVDVINPLLREYPDLKPEGWDDPYVPNQQKSGE